MQGIVGKMWKLDPWNFKRNFTLREINLYFDVHICSPTKEVHRRGSSSIVDRRKIVQIMIQASNLAFMFCIAGLSDQICPIGHLKIQIFQNVDFQMANQADLIRKPCRTEMPNLMLVS